VPLATIALSSSAVLAALLFARLVVEHETPAASSRQAARPGALPYSSGSLSQLGVVFTTDAGKPFQLSMLRGKVALLATIFTRCPSACPTLVREIRALERALPAEAGERTRIVLISIDPEYDTPERLASYRTEMALESDRWLLLHGSADDVRLLTASLGLSYGAGAGTTLSHSRRVTVLDPEGEIVHQQDGVASDAQRLIDAIERAGRAPPPRSKTGRER
jgi:protein SCO1/2